MTKIPLLLIFCFCFQIVSFAEESAILDIRNEYKSVRDSLPSMAKHEVNLNGHSTEGGRCIVSKYQTNEIRFIEASFYGETGKSIFEFYLKDGQVFFIFSQIHRYNAPFYFDEDRAKEFGVDPFDPEKTKIFEDRYYYKNNRLIRWINRDMKKVDINSNQAKEANERVTEVSDIVLSNCR